MAMGGIWAELLSSDLWAIWATRANVVEAMTVEMEEPIPRIMVFEVMGLKFGERKSVMAAGVMIQATQREISRVKP